MALEVVNTPLLQNINGVTRQINFETSAAQVKTADGFTVESRLTSLASSVSGQSRMFVVEDIAGRDAIEAPEVGYQAWVKDATADPTVSSGAAKYIYEDEETGWVKTAEAESLDIVLSWADIQDKPASTAADIDDAVAKRHEHANKAEVLDKLSVAGGNLTFDGKAIATEAGKYGAYVTVGPDDPSFEAAVAALGLADGAFFTVISGTEA